MAALFHDRREAGQELAKTLSTCADRADLLVLALPRGVFSLVNIKISFCLATLGRYKEARLKGI
jgi:predicted phosphoribosyltransferase